MAENITLQQAFDELISGGVTPELPLTEGYQKSAMPLAGQSLAAIYDYFKEGITGPIERTMAPLYDKNAQQPTLEDIFMATTMGVGAGWKGGLPTGATGVGMTRALHGAAPGKELFSRFSKEFIGSGEGGAARGYGFYFSDVRDITKVYAEKGVSEVIKDKFGEAGTAVYHYTQGNKKFALEYMDNLIETQSDYIDHYLPKTDKPYEALKEYKNIREKIKSDTLEIPDVSGKIYNVTLHPHKVKENWLEWDEPISDEIIQNLVNQSKKEGVDLSTYEFEGFQGTGGELYKDLADRMSYHMSTQNRKDIYIKNKKAASEFLDRAGIDGIRFEAGSIMGNSGLQVIKKSGTDITYVHDKFNNKVVKEFSGADSYEKAMQFKKENQPYNYVIFNPEHIEINQIEDIAGNVVKKFEKDELVSKLHPDLPLNKTQLNEIIKDVKELYPEAEGVSIVGTYSRLGEKPSTNRSHDIDILIRFPENVNKIDINMRFDEDLWNKWRKDKVGTTIDFLKRFGEVEPSYGEHQWRLEEKLSTPEIPIWKKFKK